MAIMVNRLHVCSPDSASDKMTASILRAIGELALSYWTLLDSNKGYILRFEISAGGADPQYALTVFGAESVSAEVAYKSDCRMKKIEAPDSYTSIDDNNYGWGAIRFSYNKTTITGGRAKIESGGSIAICFTGAKENFDLLLVGEFFCRLKDIFKECFPTTFFEYHGLTGMCQNDPRLLPYFHMQ